MLRRRELLLSGLALSPLARADETGAYRRTAFEAKTLPEVLAALGLAAPVASEAVLLQAPDLSEDGAVVPITLGCSAPGVQRLLLGIEKNPFWLTAVFEPGAKVEPKMATRVKMQQTSKVLALAVMNDGRVLMAAKDVQVTLGGCAGAADDVPEAANQPTLIRLQPGAAGATTVRSLMKHQMESGQRKDAAGRVVPAWYIQQVTATLEGETVLQAQWGTSVSKNPFLQFALKGAKPGDSVALAWADNRGAKRSDAAKLAAGAPAPA